MKIGLVGLKSCGKTTVFNALTGLNIDVGGFSGKNVNLGNIKVPDKRVELLSSIFNPKKTTFAQVDFVDIAGEDKSSTSSAGLSQNIISKIRDVDALSVVVRGFESALFEKPCDILRDLSLFNSELCIADMIQVERRLDRLKKEGRKDSEFDLFTKLFEHLENDNPLRTLELSANDIEVIRGFAFVTLKPALVLLNVSEDLPDSNIVEEFKNKCKEDSSNVMILKGMLEMEISQLDEEEQLEFLKDAGFDAPPKDRFIQSAYSLLDLISFFTVGPDEVKAWTIKNGTIAVNAAGKIHSDIERGFIRAEVIKYDDFMNYKSEAKCKEAGVSRLEGKEYQVLDGDIIHFRFNV